ncbi:MAG: TolC family protein [bacterium]
MPSADNPFLGGVPTAAISEDVLQLSLAEAIERGLKYNLGLFLGEQGTREAQAARLYARSGLLPTLTTSTSDGGRQVNLKALGFQGFPGVNPIVGPFNVFDTRAYLTQTVFSLPAIRNFRAGDETLAAARFSYLDARDVVVLAVAGLYWQAVAGRARIDSARAQYKTAQALYDRAVNMREAGVAAGIDVLRAQVQMQAQQQLVIFYENEFEKQKLALERAIGLPVGQRIELTDSMSYTPPPPLDLAEALELAYANRADYKSQEASVRAAEAQRAAAVAERYPSVAFAADYGAIGPRPWNSHGTFSVVGTLNIPIYQAGRVKADITQADARLENAKARLADLRNMISQQVRAALLDLNAAAAQVNVAQEAVGLARQQLVQSEDRFAAGVATSVEVVQGQEAVATAEENYISALYSYNIAKAALARAVGATEKMYFLFLKGTK